MSFFTNKALQRASLALLLAPFTSGAPDVGLCTEGSCTSCPTGFNGFSRGYPECTVYPTDIFDGYYPTSPTGGLEIFFNIPQPDPTCAFIIRSPAGTQLPGCGQSLIVAYNAACAFLTLQGTFMMQYCCGTDDCKGATGSKRSIGFSTEGLKDGDVVNISERGASIGSGSVLLSINGTEVEPLEVGSSPETRAREAEAKEDANMLEARAGGATIPLSKRACTFTQSGASYTYPGNTRVISQTYTGPATASVSSSQTVGYTTSFSAGIDAGVFSAGVDFSFETSITSEVSQDYPVPAGQTGVIVWTPTLRCADGTVSGCGSDGSGQVCSPERNGNGVAVGTFALQQRF